MVLLCVRVCHPEHNLDDFNPYLLYISKAPAQYTVQQLRYNSSEPHIGSYTYQMQERLCSPFSTCDTPRTIVHHVPKGNLVLYWYVLVCRVPGSDEIMTLLYAGVLFQQ